MPASDRLQRPSSWIEFVSRLVLGRGGSRLEVGTHESQQEDAAAVLQLHVAEYQALTTRITYWIPIQYSLGGAIALTLVNFLQADANHAPSGLFTWATVIALEVLIGAFCFVLFEIMTDSDYIENKLAKKIVDNLPSAKDFWGNQRYRKGNRVYSPAGMYVPMIPCIAAPYAALLFFRPWHREIMDFLFAAASMILAFWVFRIAYAAVSTQRRFAP